MEDAGFKISKTSATSNPHYEVRYTTEAAPIIAFSKKYMDASNPTSNFIAIITCSHADQNCPFVAGASLRVATPYDDPKRQMANRTKMKCTRSDANKLLQRCYILFP